MTRAASYGEATSVDGERAVFRGAIHWGVYVPPALTGVAAFLLQSIPALSMIVWAGAAWLFIGATARHLTTEILLTSRRVVYKTGLVARKTVEIENARIEGVALSQSVLGRLLNYGDLTIRGTGAGAIDMRGLADPAAVRRALNR